MSANASSAAYALVTINGILQLPGTDYTIANNLLTFTSNCAVNDVVDARIFTTGASVLGGSPGGANTWVQINDGGQFGGNANLTYNKATNTLNVGGINANLLVAGVNVVNVLLMAYASANTGQNTVGISSNSLNFLPGRLLNFVNTQSTIVSIQDVGNGNANVSFTTQQILMVPVGAVNLNSASALTAGLGQNYVRSPKAFTFTTVKASLLQSSSSGNVTVQIRGNANSNLLSTALTINSGQKTSLTATQQPVVNVALQSIGYDDQLLFDVIGAGTNAIGLIITLLGNG